MSDLTGEDAFDRLLERTLDSRVEVRRAEDERDAALRTAREWERISKQQNDKLAALEATAARNLPLLERLWKAADAISRTSPNVTDADMAERRKDLREAVAGAVEACNQIPF